jgi:hypothetical protein
MNSRKKYKREKVEEAKQNIPKAIVREAKEPEIEPEPEKLKETFNSKFNGKY